MSLLEKVDTILSFLEEINGKLDRLLASENFDEDSPERVKQIKAMDRMIEMDMKPNNDYMLPKTGEYQWYKLKGDDKAKLRKCSNEGCPMFLKYNGDKKKYEHWKYDANTGVGGYVQDTCDYYFPEGL